MKTKAKELTDIQLRDALLDRLDKDPKVTSTEIGVGTSHGVVTLSGFVRTDAEKREAERAAREVAGVKDVANEIQVRPYSAMTEADIAHEARLMLESRLNAPADRIFVSVEDYVLTLSGEVDDGNQKQAAEDALRNLKGIRGIRNQIIAKRPATR